MANYSEAMHIKLRRKIVKKMLDEGIKASEIIDKLKVVKEGKFSASKATISRDIKEIVKKRENWDKIHNPHQMDIWQEKRHELIKELDELAQEAKKRKQYKTASEIIARKARLLGVDKFIAPKEKKKDDIEEKYKHKSEEEINEILFQEFKDLSATFIRMAKNKKLNNVEKITIRVIRKEQDGKKTRYIISRFGDEKMLSNEQKDFVQ